MAAYLVVEARYNDLGWTTAYRRDVPKLMEAAGACCVAKSLSREPFEG